jgi:hypothetical protein
LPSVFGTRRRLPTSATAFPTCGQPNHRLSLPRRDDGLDHLPFLSQHALSLTGAVLSGEPRITRFAPAPVPVPPVFTGLPDRDAVSNATPSWGIPQKVECRFVCTGLWAQRRTRPAAREADHASFVGCERFLNALADVPFPSWVFPRGHPHVTGASVDKSGAPAFVTDRSSSPLFRHTAKRAGFPKNGMPFTVVTTAGG